MSERKLVELSEDLIEVLGTENEPPGWVADLKADWQAGITVEEAGAVADYIAQFPGVVIRGDLVGEGGCKLRTFTREEP